MKTETISTINTSQFLAFNFFKRATPEIIIGLASALIVTATAWNLFDQKLVMSWVASTVVLYLIRLLNVRLPAENTITASRYGLFVFLLLTGGILWGAAGYAAVLQDSVLHKSGILIWIVCLVFMVTLIYSGSLTLFFCFAIPALGLPVYALLSQTSPWHPLVTILLIATGSFLFLLSLIYRRSFLDTLEIRPKYEQLIEEHQSLQEESDRLEVTLKTTIQKHQEIISNLKQASQNLDQCETRKENLVNTLKSTMKNDPVTNLSNRRGFLETINKEWQRAIRSRDPLTLAFIKIDDFDAISKENDKSTVLSTLKKVADSIRSHGRRAGDLPARLDKADFALLLQGADAKNAARIIENVRSSISKMHLPRNSKGEPVTIHAGVATLVPNRKSQPEKLIERVESAAYEAAFQGGDRVISFHAFNNIEIIPWNTEKSGELNETNFQQKLLSMGYNTKRETIPPRTKFRDQSFVRPTLFAVYSGIFHLNIEGQIYEMKRGSSMVMPEGISFNAEVVGDSAVVLYLEKR